LCGKDIRGCLLTPVFFNASCLVLSSRVARKGCHGTHYAASAAGPPKLNRRPSLQRGTRAGIGWGAREQRTDDVCHASRKRPWPVMRLPFAKRAPNSGAAGRPFHSMESLRALEDSSER
jgi:hypothetical protein